MLDWIARIFFNSKVKRIQYLKQALQYMEIGNLDKATELVNSQKPSQYLQDVALWHFVVGKLALETGDPIKAELHITTAWALGLQRPATMFSLGLAKAKNRRLDEARELLALAMSQYEASGEEQQVVIAKELIKLIDEALSGRMKEIIALKVKEFAKKHLTTSKKKEWREGDWRHLIKKAIELKSEDSIAIPEVAIAILGEYMIWKYNGHWILGLELQDHGVLINGAVYSPYRELALYYAGRLELEDVGKLSSEVLSVGIYEEDIGVES